MVSIQEAANSVTQSARAQWDNLSRRNEDQLLNTSSRGFRDGLDSLLRTMFAPCAGDIGGVPRDEIFDRKATVNKPPQPLIRKLSKQPSPTPPVVPFEVAATTSDVSSKRTPPAPFQKESLSKLRQLGAQHQLASGLHGESLADVARPCSPEKTETPDLIDFDDGISAISSHTLEEMERKRIQNGGAPIAVTVNKPAPITEDVEWKPQKEEKIEISRISSNCTKHTHGTEESFQKFIKDEAEYWDQEVAKERRSRGVDRPSIEERAARLRELSRSRSRSDGTGSNKSHPNRLKAHPHDTVPVFPSDLFGKTRPLSKSTSRNKKSTLVPGSFDNSDPFAALDFGEI